MFDQQVELQLVMWAWCSLNADFWNATEWPETWAAEPQLHNQTKRSTTKPSTAQKSTCMKTGTHWTSGRAQNSMQLVALTFDCLHLLHYITIIMLQTSWIDTTSGHHEIRFHYFSCCAVLQYLCLLDSNYFVKVCILYINEIGNFKMFLQHMDYNQA